MALKPCKECDQKVSTKAKTCPNCGVKKPAGGVMQTEIGGGIGVLFLIVIFVGMCFAMVGDGGSGSGGQSSDRPPSTPPLSASVQFDGTQFVISNEDPFAWTDCEFVLNGGVFGGGYQLRPDRIEGGTTYLVGSMRFADGDGMRFNPGTMVPQSFDIHCMTPSGRAHYNGTWE